MTDHCHHDNDAMAQLLIVELAMLFLKPFAVAATGVRSLASLSTNLIEDRMRKLEAVSGRNLPIDAYLRRHSMLCWSDRKDKPLTS